MRLTESNTDIVPLENVETLTTINDTSVSKINCTSVGTFIVPPNEMWNELHIYIRETRTSTKYKAVVEFSSRWTIRTSLIDIVLGAYYEFMKSDTSENKTQLLKQAEIYLRHHSILSMCEYEVYDVRVIEMKRIELL